MSRDRGKEFTKAATQALPHAQQVVDRFHLVRNLAEVLQVILGHCRAEIRQAESPSPGKEKALEKDLRPLPTAVTWQQRTPPHVEKAHQARQASRDDRYRQMKDLRAQGLTQAEVAEPHGHVGEGGADLAQTRSGSHLEASFPASQCIRSLRSLCARAVARGDS